MVKKNDSESKRNIAEDMYIRLGATGREIAEITGVTEQTVSRWKKGRDGEKSWDERKDEMSLTPMKIKELLLAEAAAIAKGEKRTDAEGNEIKRIDADGLSKIMAAIDRLDKKVNVRIIADVFKEFDNYVAEIEPKIAVEFTKYHKMYLKHRISMEG